MSSILAFTQFVAVVLTWELAWRDYGPRPALLCYAGLTIIGALHTQHLATFPERAVYFAFVMTLSYATGGLTRRIFGAGKKYSLRLPTLD